MSVRLMVQPRNEAIADYLKGFLFKISFKFIFNVCLFLRERQSASGGGAESGRDTESEAGFGLSTESDAGLEFTNHEITT